MLARFCVTHRDSVLSAFLRLECISDLSLSLFLMHLVLCFVLMLSSTAEFSDANHPSFQCSPLVKPSVPLCFSRLSHLLFFSHHDAPSDSISLSSVLFAPVRWRWTLLLSLPSCFTTPRVSFALLVGLLPFCPGPTLL